MKRRTVDIINFYGGAEVDKQKLRRFVRLLDAELPDGFKAPEGDLSIAVFGDGGIAKIHKDFMNKPTPTDVITFEAFSDGDGQAGEICVSAETAKAAAPKFGNTPSRELSLYVAHGYLHLAGVDDIAEADARVMRKMENECLKILDAHFKTPIFKFND